MIVSYRYNAKEREVALNIGGTKLVVTKEDLLELADHLGDIYEDLGDQEVDEIIDVEVQDQWIQDMLGRDKCSCKGQETVKIRACMNSACDSYDETEVNHCLKWANVDICEDSCAVQKDVSCS